MKQNKNHLITLRVDNELYEYLKKSAKINNCTISDVIREKIKLKKTWKEPRENTIR